MEILLIGSVRGRVPSVTCGDELLHGGRISRVLYLFAFLLCVYENILIIIFVARNIYAYK